MATLSIPPVVLATEDEDLGLVPAETAKAEAQALADETGKAVTLRDSTSDEVMKTIKPRKAKTPAAKATSVSKGEAKITKAPKPQPAKPTGRVAEILKLAARKQGVTPAELNELTKWKGAPWRWLFSNWQGTGYCDRWGYSFEARKGEDRRVSYHVKKAAQAST